MDWLRSENLKEEKNVTAPITMIAGGGSIAPVELAGGARRTIGRCIGPAYNVPPQMLGTVR
jgi:hypothetical protein